MDEDLNMLFVGNIIHANSLCSNLKNQIVIIYHYNPRDQCSISDTF